MNILIRGGRVIDPDNGVDGQLDVLIDGGCIARVERGIEAADRVVDATDRLVVPGLIDMHVHLREPGQTHKEDIASGTLAAVAGGFTTVCCMPNTAPVNDCTEVTGRIVARAREVGRARVHPIAAITRGLAGRELTDFQALGRAGVVALSDDGRCVMDSAVMRAALERAREANLLLIQHCEDHALSAGGAANEGPWAEQLGLSAQPPQAESVMVARDLELLELTGGRYHVAHLSTRSSARHVRAARERGLQVSCEATPHHFCLTEEACAEGDPLAKVNPPLRSSADVAALREAIADGTVDVIATDHAPHAAEEKASGFEQAPFGISGIETAVPASLSLWRDGVVGLERVIAMLTCNPARLLGLPGGALSVGAPADVTVIDPDRAWTVTPERLRSRGKNTPLLGREVRGLATLTLVNGQIVFEDGA
jgi:dihydroorotase